MTFYVVKGCLALLGTLLLLKHMRHEMNAASMDWGRIMRYLSLLTYGVVQTSASVEQLHERAPVNFRNVLGMVAAAVLVLSMVVSIWGPRIYVWWRAHAPRPLIRLEDRARLWLARRI